MAFHPMMEFPCLDGIAMPSLAMDRSDLAMGWCGLAMHRGDLPMDRGDLAVDWYVLAMDRGDLAMGWYVLASSGLQGSACF